MERRYDTMPKWYYDTAECKRRYLAYVTYSTMMVVNKK